MAEENTIATNNENTKEEALESLKEMMGDEEKNDIDTTSFLWGMAAGAAITGATIFIYNKFFSED